MEEFHSLFYSASDLLVAALMLVGAFFMFLAGVGMLRFPDLFMRLHASTKSATLGVSGMFLAMAVYFGRDGHYDIVMLSFLVILFVFLTAPVAGHVIARASYLGGTPLWERSKVDELRGHYDFETGALRSFEAEAPAEESQEADDE
jgi:multicomponent Na+:H+ antiporter subunit G